MRFPVRSIHGQRYGCDRHGLWATFYFYIKEFDVFAFINCGCVNIFMQNVLNLTFYTVLSEGGNRIGTKNFENFTKNLFFLMSISLAYEGQHMHTQK